VGINNFLKMPKLEEEKDDFDESFIHPNVSSNSNPNFNVATHSVAAEKVKAIYYTGDLVDVLIDGNWNPGVIVFGDVTGDSFDIKLSENSKTVVSIDRSEIRSTGKDHDMSTERIRRRSRTSFGFSSHTQFLNSPYIEGNYAIGNKYHKIFLTE
jgi:hypothetical protein